MAVPTDRLYDTPPLPSPASPAAFVPLISASPEATYHDEPVPPPEGMELFELAVSGPVGERVNLAFFADGCEFRGANRLGQLTSPPKTPLLSATSLWRTRASSPTTLCVLAPWSTSPTSSTSSACLCHRKRYVLANLKPPHSTIAQCSCRSPAWVKTSRLSDRRLGCSGLVRNCVVCTLRSRTLLARRASTGTRPRKAAATKRFCSATTGYTVAWVASLRELRVLQSRPLTRRVITASPLNGPLVLRHELGHSLIPVGEEYEGGTWGVG